MWAGGVGFVVLATAGGIGAWALNRYVIDHVEIADVAAYEAQFNAERASSATALAGTTTLAGTTATSTPTATDSAASPIDSTSATAGTNATAAADTSSSAASTAPVLTESSYQAGATSITIEKVVVGSGDDTVTYYVADVVLGDATELRAAFADNKFGQNIVADTSEIATGNGAVFAINGDYYGFRTSGIVIRNGVIFRDEGARTGLAIYRDGTMALYDETTTSAEQLLADGVWNTLSFGPGLLDDGELVTGMEDFEVDTNIGNHSIQGNQPRTGIGMISENHFVFIAVDGRSRGYSRGVTMTEFAELFAQRGATVAYNLDGGGSTTMWFNGSVVNDPLGKGDERGTSDILYIGQA